MRVLNKQVAIKVSNSGGGHTTKGGLFVMAAGDDGPILNGEVTLVGENVVNIKPGENVYFSKFNSSKISLPDDDIYILDIANVLLVE